MRSHAKTLLLVISLAAACSKGDSKQPPAPQGSGSAAPEAPKPAEGSVAIYVDDQQVGTLAREQLATWPRLDTLIPMTARRLGTWQTIALKGAKKSANVDQPSGSYPDLVPALFPGEGGAPAFGMFDPVELAKKGTPKLREDAIAEVRIMLTQGSNRGQNDHGDGGGSDPTKLELAIKTAKGEQVLKGEKLLETPREPLPGETGEAKGWPLSVILANAGVAKYERLLLTGENGTNLTLEKQDLDPKASVPFIKLNRQGSLRFRVYKKQGELWQAGADLRGLVRIEILK
jgi:hypothetical protein